MVQSSPKERALLGVEPFWERPTLKTPLRLERWRIILKLAIIAKEGISIDILREAPPFKVILPPEPIWTKIRPKVREIVEYVMKNSKTHVERSTITI